MLPQEILDALSGGKINEGHTRPLMMLSSRPEEQQTLFKEIVYRKITVREAERIARRIAVDKARKKELIPSPELMQIEKKLEETLGTRVHIEPKEVGGKITIDYFSNDDLDTIMDVFNNADAVAPRSSAENIAPTSDTPLDQADAIRQEIEAVVLLDDRSREEARQADEEIDDLYNIKNFSL